MNDQQHQVVLLNCLLMLRWIRNKQDQHGDHIGHKTGYQELNKGYGHDGHMDPLSGLSVHHLSGQMHGNVDDDHAEEQLKVLLHLRPDVNSGADLHNA